MTSRGGTLPRPLLAIASQKVSDHRKQCFEPEKLLIWEKMSQKVYSRLKSNPLRSLSDILRTCHSQILSQIEQKVVHLILTWPNWTPPLHWVRGGSLKWILSVSSFFANFACVSWSLKRKIVWLGPWNFQILAKLSVCLCVRTCLCRYLVLAHFLLVGRDYPIIRLSLRT